MKGFRILFLICYILTTAFFIVFFGNMNFFGEQGFHLEVYDLIYILFTWALISALVLSGIIYGIAILIKKIIGPQK